MTTPETVRVLEHVSATVKGREDKGEDGWRIQVDIPSFKTKYPTVLNFVAADIAAKLIPNTAVNLVLVRDKLRTDSNGKSYDGKWKWHYWWRLDSFWDGAQQVSPPAAEPKQPKVVEPSAPIPRPSWDDRTVDIEAAWAINQARELLQYHAEEIGPDNLTQMAQWFLDAKLRLTNAMRSGVRVEPAQEPSPEAQSDHGELVEPPAAQSSPASVMELLNRGMKELGYKDRAAMFAALGIQSATELASPEKLAAAWSSLTAARKAR